MGNKQSQYDVRNTYRDDIEPGEGSHFESFRSSRFGGARGRNHLRASKSMQSGRLADGAPRDSNPLPSMQEGGSRSHRALKHRPDPTYVRAMRQNHVNPFGPPAAESQVESSHSFSKELSSRQAAQQQRPQAPGHQYKSSRIESIVQSGGVSPGLNNPQLQRQMTLSRRLDVVPTSEAEDRMDASQTQFLAETLDQRQQDSDWVQAQGQVTGRLTKKSGAITSRQGAPVQSARPETNTFVTLCPNCENDLNYTSGQNACETCADRHRQALLSAHNAQQMKRLKSVGYEKYQYQSKDREPGLLCYPVGVTCCGGTFGCCGPSNGAEVSMQSTRPIFQAYTRAPSIQINRYAQVSRLKRKLLLSSQSRSQKRSGGSYFDDAGSYEDIVQRAHDVPSTRPNLSQTQQILAHRRAPADTDFSRTQKLTVTTTRLDMHRATGSAADARVGGSASRIPAGERQGGGGVGGVSHFGRQSLLSQGKYSVGHSPSQVTHLSQSPSRAPSSIIGGRDSSKLSVVEGLDGASYVNITNDPFKTGNKHFYNMLRPALYKMHFDQEKERLKHLAEVTGMSQGQVDQLEQHLKVEQRPSEYYKPKARQLTIKEIRFLNDRFIKDQDDRPSLKAKKKPQRQQQIIKSYKAQPQLSLNQHLQSHVQPHHCPQNPNGSHLSKPSMQQFGSRKMSGYDYRQISKR